MGKLLVKLFFGFLLGIIPSIWVVQNDPNIKKLVLDPIIVSIEKSSNLKMDIDDISINLFTGFITLKNLRLKTLGPVPCIWLSKKSTIQMLKKKLYLR